MVIGVTSRWQLMSVCLSLSVSWLVCLSYFSVTLPHWDASLFDNNLRWAGAFREKNVQGGSGCSSNSVFKLVQVRDSLSRTLDWKLPEAFGQQPAQHLPHQHHQGHPGQKLTAVSWIFSGRFDLLINFFVFIWHDKSNLE